MKFSLKKTSLSLVLLLLLGTACNQVGLGALSAAKNAIMAPFDGISNIISNRRYNTIEERTPSSTTDSNSSLEELVFSSSEGDQTRCEADQDTTLAELPSELAEVMIAARETACSCRPWGTCSKSECSCEKLCPDNFSIFKRSPYNQNISDLSSRENSLSFRNIGAMEMSDIEGTNGYCWGHASVTSQFNRLASFNSDDTTMIDQLNEAPDSPKRIEALNYYKSAIDDIIDNKVATFSGFPNLYELSSHPDLESYLATEVSKQWADRAMSIQGVRTALGIGAMSREKSVSFLEEIAQKIDNHQQPQIVFTSQGQIGRTHALLVSHYERTDEGLVLCLRDNNYSPMSNETCSNKMELDEEGGLSYSPWGKLGRAALAHNDNSDALKQFRSLKEECDKQQGCD